MKPEWWFYRVVLPLCPLFFGLVVLVLFSKLRQVTSLYREGQLCFFAVSLSVFTMSEYKRLSIPEDMPYYFHLFVGVLTSTVLFGVASAVKQGSNPPAEKEKVLRRIASVSLLVAALVVYFAQRALAGRGG